MVTPMPSVESVVTVSPESQPQILLESERPEFDEEFHRLVAERAYEIFQESGGVPGGDVTNWLQAEGELATRLNKVRRSRVWFTVSASVPGVTAEDVQVCSHRNRAIVFVQREIDRDRVGESSLHSRYYVVRWPEDVEPESVRAHVENGSLTLIACQAQ